MNGDVAARDPLAGELAWAGYGSLVTAAFVAATMLGVGGRPLTMAVGGGAAALASSCSLRLTPPAFVALVGVPVASAACLGGGRGRELAGVVLLLALATWREQRLPAVITAGAALLLAGGVFVGEANGALVAYAVAPGASPLAAALLAAAAVGLLAAAMASERRNPLVVLLVPALLAGLAAAGGSAVEPRLALAIAGVAAVIAAAAERPAGALAALSIAASVGIDESAVVALLAVAAVLVGAWPPRPVPPSLVAAVPALAGLAAVVTANPTGLAVGLAGFATVCAVALLTRVDASDWLRMRVVPPEWPAAALAVWVVMAPQTWGWLGPIPPAVRITAAGIASAAAVVALALVAVAASRAAGKPE